MYIFFDKFMMSETAKMLICMGVYLVFKCAKDVSVFGLMRDF